ncbi:MAG: NEL-type E3 ubiquitin ligase domain-containing protein, partial [Exilibacterium sp.]
PASIGRLTNLERLWVDSNDLEALPDSLVQLSKLQKMNISFNQITRLPDGMAGMSSLQSLDISANLLQTLPDDLASLPLIKLKANQVQFAEVPPVIFSMVALEELTLNLNAITTLPPEIAQLQNLSTLDVSFCRLSSLPEEIAQLPHDCEVEVCGNSLSEAIRGNFARIYEAGGPQIQFMVDEGLPVERASQPLEANVTKWMMDLSPEQLHVTKWMMDLSPEQLHKWQQLGTESRADHFNTWLEFMDQTADFENEQTRPHLTQRMRHLLSDLTRMLETRGDTQLAAYLGIAEEATSSCRDRIAIGLNNMELQQVNFRASKGELSSSQLLTIGREMFICDGPGSKSRPR